MNGFGFVESMNKLGVERRLLIAGTHKALLDPFSPVNPQERAHVQGVIDGVHRQFIDAVRQGRGGRLKETPDMFTGLVWTGAEGIQLGLADEIGDVRSVAEKVIGAEKLVDFTPREDLVQRLSQHIGAAFAGELTAALSAFRMR
jgi:protease-4